MQRTQGCRLPSPPTGPTFEQLYGTQLEGDVVLLGEDVDGPAGLGHQVQVELQTHSGGCGSGGWQTSETDRGGTASGDGGVETWGNGEQERLGPGPSGVLSYTRARSQPFLPLDAHENFGPIRGGLPVSSVQFNLSCVPGSNSSLRLRAEVKGGAEHTKGKGT